MSAPTTAASFYGEITNATYVNNGNTTTIFAVKSIRVNRKRTILKGYDNNKSRAVAVHGVLIDETITIETEDMNAIDQLELTVGPGALSFTGIAFAHNSTTGQNGNQLYTFTNFVIDSDSANRPAKGTSSGSISGFTMESAAGEGTDAEVFIATSSSSTGVN